MVDGLSHRVSGTRQGSTLCLAKNLPGICGLILQEVSIVLGKLMLSTGLRNSSHLSIKLLVHF